MPKSAAQEHVPVTAVTFQILLSLSRGPLHGWALRRDVEERTGGRVTLQAGTLYTGLQRLERQGLIQETPCPPSFAEEASSRWRFYQTTELGREVLLAEASRMEEDLHALREILAPES